MTALAEALAAALGEEWTALPDHPEGHGRGELATLLRASDGALVMVDRAGSRYDPLTRYDIAGGHTTLSLEHSWQHHITVTATAAPATVAGHIRRRLVAGWLDGAIVTAREKAEEKARELAARTALMRRLLCVAPAGAGARVRDDSHGRARPSDEQKSMSWWGMDAPYGCAEVALNHDATRVLDLHFRWLSPEAAEAAIAAVAAVAAGTRRPAPEEEPHDRQPHRRARRPRAAAAHREDVLHAGLW